MGYRSEISVLVTLPKNVSARKVVNAFKKAWGDYDFKECFEVDSASVEGCVYIGTIEDLKWYTGSLGFEEVNNFMELINHWEEHFKSGGVHFIRIGESYDDVEEIVSGDVKQYLSLNRVVELP